MDILPADSTVRRRILLVTVNDLIRLLTSLHKVEAAYTEFERFMKEHIASQKSEARKTLALGDPPNNLFSRLVQASVTEGPYGLEDQELLGNFFIFLFAGHG